MKHTATPYRLPVPTSPLAPVELPNGSVQRVVRLDRDGWQLFGELQRSGSDTLALQLIRRMLPEASDVDVMCVVAAPETLEALFLYVVGRTQDFTVRKDLT